MKFKTEDSKPKIVFFVFFIFVFNFSVSASDINDTNSTAAIGSWRQDGKRFVGIAFEDAKKTFFDRDNLLLLLMAGGGSIALADRADDKIAENFERHRSIPRGLDNITDLVGNPGMHFAATGLWYGIAANKKDDINIQRSWIMFRALAVTNATTLSLKLIANNHTPNGKSLAWPSGHTSSSFTVASVLDEFYGPKVGIPAYLAAGFVGYRMMDSGDHWASDVLFGGVLGYVVGHAIAGENKKLQFAGYRIQPLVTTLHSRPSAGIALAKEF
ncbi:MAG: phosphatase PAP2 family protein [Phycisphaerae bacterium]|nr:phosphatase PAP2 family protein [Phycisphaerae bacterium]